MSWLYDRKAAVNFGKGAFVTCQGFQNLFRTSRDLALIFCIQLTSSFVIDALSVHRIWTNNQK